MDATFRDRLATAARQTDFARDLSRELVTQVDGEGRTVADVYHAFGLLTDLVQGLLAYTDDPLDPTGQRHLREQLALIGATAWKTALDLGLAAGIPEGQPRLASFHPELETIEKALQIRGLDRVVRYSDWVEFTDRDGIACQATIRRCYVANEPSYEDDDQVESEGEVRPQVEVGERWPDPANGRPIEGEEA